MVRSATRVTAEVIEAARALEVIGRAGVGLDNVDVEAATRRGIVCMNTPGGNTIAAAEHTMALLLAVARAAAGPRPPPGGKWERERFLGAEVYGKTLGMVGLGRIGTEVARRAQGFEMTVVAYDPYLGTEVAERLGVELVDLDALLRRADFITVHLPLTKETRGLIGAAELGRTKPGVRLVNCAGAASSTRPRWRRRSSRGTSRAPGSTSSSGSRRGARRSSTWSRWWSRRTWAPPPRRRRRRSRWRSPSRSPTSSSAAMVRHAVNAPSVDPSSCGSWRPTSRSP